MRRWLATSTAAAALALTTTGCGFNLMRTRHEVELRSPAGEAAMATIWVRPLLGPATPLGMGSGGGELLILVFVVVEAVDIVGSTGFAAASIFDGERSLSLGPAGWILSLLPGITAIPDVPEFDRIVLNETTWQAVVDGTPNAATLLEGELQAAHPSVDFTITEIESVRVLEWDSVEWRERVLR